jgi:hypothetical protein
VPLRAAVAGATADSRTRPGVEGVAEEELECKVRAYGLSERAIYLRAAALIKIAVANQPLVRLTAKWLVLSRKLVLTPPKTIH